MYAAHGNQCVYDPDRYYCLSIAIYSNRIPIIQSPIQYNYFGLSIQPMFPTNICIVVHIFLFLYSSSSTTLSQTNTGHFSRHAIFISIQRSFFFCIGTSAFLWPNPVFLVLPKTTDFQHLFDIW